MEIKPTIFILSDSVGDTAELVIKAGLSQFLTKDYEIERVPYVEDEQTIDETLQSVKEKEGILGFTMVNPDLRMYINKQAKKLEIESIDIMGPMMDAMGKVFKDEPRLEPGLVYKLDKDYFERIESIEFAVRYDDGRDPRGISKADIVLIGVSRTSKTPLSQYLAHKRLKVANVPVMPEVDVPEELFDLDPKKCIGLKINPDKLNNIRKERLKALGLGEHANYAQKKRIEEELVYFNKIIDKLGCEVIDVSDKAVEETANIILQNHQELASEYKG